METHTKSMLKKYQYYLSTNIKKTYITIYSEFCCLKYKKKLDITELNKKQHLTLLLCLFKLFNEKMETTVLEQQYKE